MSSVSLINGHIDPDKNRMTYKETIKALECCVKDDILEADNKACLECPMNDDNACTFNLRKYTLDLINRQQAEIERLETNCLSMAQTMPNMAKAERAEAIKEFAERLEDEASEKVGIDEDFLYYDFDDEFKTFDSVADVIKFLSAIVIKEMVGEDK